MIELPVFSRLAPEAFRYGMNFLVEFDPDSLWYETSLTLASSALRRGIKTEYNTFHRSAEEIRAELASRGLHSKKLEKQGILRIIDEFTITTGMTNSVVSFKSKSWQNPSSNPFDLDEWTRLGRKQIKEGIAENEKRWLYMNDDASVLLQYVDDETNVNFLRTTFYPWAKARQLLMFDALVKGTATESHMRKLEALNDGVIDLRAKEELGKIEQHVRIRKIRGTIFDSTWHRLRISKDGNVEIADLSPARKFEFDSERTNLIFDHLASDFLRDYMELNYMQEKSGWRTIGEIARETGIPVSSLYTRGHGPATPFRELSKRGLVEIRISPEERGRGGEVTRMRVAYEKDPVREYVNLLAKKVAKKGSQ
jgi:KaiC/GvpD/RAD55 family RecA-like ATPase